VKPYEEFAPDPLSFPIAGKTYVVPEVGYVAGMKLQEIEAGNADVSGEDQWRLLLGTAYDEMTADNVPQRAIYRACMAALVEYRTGSRELAETVWESGILPELRASQEEATETETPATGEATSTKRPASMSGTSTPRATTKKRKPRSTAS
jgi:hypothetical protein